MLLLCSPCCLGRPYLPLCNLSCGAYRPLVKEVTLATYLLVAHHCTVSKKIRAIKDDPKFTDRQCRTHTRQPNWARSERAQISKRGSLSATIWVRYSKKGAHDPEWHKLYVSH